MTTASAPWWIRVEGRDLAQGDYLPGCFVPFFDPSYGVGTQTHDVPVKEYDCIILTQSCDLENDKAPLVALCPLYPIADYEQANPQFKSGWERVRLGRVEGLHLLASMNDPQDNSTSWIACFIV